MKTKTRKDREFEEKSEVVLTQVLAIRGATDIQTKRNAAVETIVPGQNTEIDVVAEYVQNGKPVRLAVECKHHGRPVSKTIYAGFRGALADLKHPPAAMMVSKAGFQKGAGVLARANSISLAVLAEAHPKFFVNQEIPKVEAQAIYVHNQARDVKLDCTLQSEWHFETLRQFVASASNDEIILETEEGVTLSFSQVYREAFLIRTDENLNREISVFEFKSPTFLLIPDLGKVRVAKFWGVFQTRRVPFELKNEIQHLFADLDSQETFLIDKAMTVMRPGDKLVAEGPCFDTRYFDDEDRQRTKN